MKKILVLHPYIAPYRVDLYNKLATIYKLNVICWYRKKDEKNLGFDLRFVNQQANFNFEYLKGSIFLKNRFLNFLLILRVLKIKPDIIFPHEFGFNTLISIFLKKILKYKIFVTCDDSPEMAKYSSKLKVFFRNLTIRNVDGLIVVHPDVAEFLAHNYRKTKCRFIFFPIIQNDEILVSRMKNAKIISENWIIDNNLLGKKIVLYVGRLAKEKAVDVLIKALYEVLKVESNTVLIIVGDGEEKIVLEELVDTLNLNEHVLFKGKLIGNPLYAWYNLAQIFVLPSIFEPFGAVVNEALVAGCYTIVSDKVGARCLINTKNGLIFNANNIKQLSDGIINFVTKIKPITNIVESENQMDKNFQFYYHNLIDFITFDHEN